MGALGRRDRRATVRRQPGNGPFPDTRSADIPIADFPASRTETYRFLSKLPVCCMATAA